MNRRDFLRLAATASAALPAGSAVGGANDDAGSATSTVKPRSGGAHEFSGDYTGEHLSRVAFPLGGLGAGTICLEGSGALSHVSVRNRPDVFNEPGVFAALALRGAMPTARVLEGPVPTWKLFGRPGAASGDAGGCLGLPRFRHASFRARFPFGEVTLRDPDMPVAGRLTGWSPFSPGEADEASWPVAALEYELKNESAETLDAVFSFNAKNFLALEGAASDIGATRGGFVLHGAGTTERPWDDASLAVWVDDPAVQVNHAWFRGGWWDALTIAWREVADGASYARPPVHEGSPPTGATLFVPFRLAPGATKTIAVRLAWFAPATDLRTGRDLPAAEKAPRETYRPWYAGHFADLADVVRQWEAGYAALKEKAQRFSRCFHDSTLPPEVVEAVAANLSILKSPTILRQTDGRLWAWEGCNDTHGQGDLCTHVWNYAQAIPHLFPSLERTLRETEVGPSQNADGRQTYRSAVPIRPIEHQEFDAADGQLGGIIKVHREWRISGDTAWLRAIWPKVRVSLNYCIETWDPRHTGWLEEPQHNTYDIEFWGPNGMCTSIYLAALRAAVTIGEALGDDVSFYARLLAAGRPRMEQELFGGEFFAQKIEWKNLRAKLPDVPVVPWTGVPLGAEAKELMDREGPNYQYGTGCLSDGVIGAWFAEVCGVGEVLDAAKVRSHLRAVHRYNLKRDLSSHANPQRPTYAEGAEGGLLLCSWPQGGRVTLPFVYSDEVWTGIEYQVASHLMLVGLVNEGLEVVRTCRGRYDGRVRNPFDEYEWGHWYARAMASYALLQGLSGARYDAVEKVLHFAPSLAGDFRCFLSTATGYGTVGVKNGKPFLEVASGAIEVKETRFTPAKAAREG